jgi:membrane protein
MPLRLLHRPAERLFGIDRSRLDAPRRAGLLALQTLFLAFRNWIADHCALRAAALTYMTLMAIVPFLALGAVFARGFDLDKNLWDWLDAKVGRTAPEIHTAIVTIRGAVDETRSSLLAGAGAVLLVWTAISVFGRVEQAFAEIWKTRPRRGRARRYGGYLAVIFIAPLLFLGALSFNALVAGSRLVVGLRERFPVLEHAVGALGLLVPLAIQVALFTALYRAVPGAQVRWRHALAGGAVAGILWHGAQGLYFGLQYGLTRASTIYGSFAALPLLLAFFYLSWSVLLFGGEIAHAAGQVGFLRRWPGAPRSRRASRAAHLAVLSEVVRAYREGRGPWRPPGTVPLARETVEAAVENLVTAGLLARTESPPGAILPTKDPRCISLLEAVRAGEAPGAEDWILPEPLAEAVARADTAANAVLGRLDLDGALAGSDGVSGRGQA